MTDQQIMQLILGANNKDFESFEEKDEKKNEHIKKAAEQKDQQEMIVTKIDFKRILRRDLNEEKKA